MNIFIFLNKFINKSQWIKTHFNKSNKNIIKNKNININDNNKLVK